MPLTDSGGLSFLKAKWQALVLLAMCSALVIGVMASGDRPAMSDELDIAEPARSYLAGDIHADVKYPSFPFYFYGAFCAAAGTLDDPSACVRTARFGNALLSALNLLLFYLFAARVFRIGWALVATAMLLSIPSFIWSAFVVKTEALLLCELFVLLLALQRILDDPGRRRWHALAAVAAGLAVSTKVLFYPALLYAINHLFLAHRERRLRIGPALVFASVFLLTVLATWTNLWIFDEVIRSWHGDRYFIPGAAPWTAVDETWALLYGRYGSFVSMTMPMSIGLFGVVTFLASVAFRTWTRWLGWVFGIGTLLYLFIALTAMRPRVPHPFTPYFPFMVVASVTFFRWLTRHPLTAGRGAGRALIAFLLLVAFGSYAYSASWMTSFWTGFQRFRQLDEMLYERDDSELVTFPETYEARSDQTLRDLLATRRPAFVLLYSSFIHNMCKYRTRPIYQDNCAFFQELLSGDAGYRILETFELPLPGGKSCADAEIRESAFYLFGRADLEATEAIWRSW